MAIGPFRTYMTPVNLSRLAVYAAGEVVSPDTLLEKGIIKKVDEGQDLATGELALPLTIKAHGSAPRRRQRSKPSAGQSKFCNRLRTIGR